MYIHTMRMKRQRFIQVLNDNNNTGNNNTGWLRKADGLLFSNN